MAFKERRSNILTADKWTENTSDTASAIGVIAK
jgi:hypothetical protein